MSKDLRSRLDDLHEKNDHLSRELAKAKSMAYGMGSEIGGGGPASTGISVGTPGRYKGYRLKAEIASLCKARPDDRHAAVKAEWRADPARAEAVAKFWIDLYDTAVKRPGVETAVFKEGMNEGTPGAGGYLTPTEQAQEWDGYARDESVALQYCRTVPMSSDTKLVNKEDGTVASLGGVALNTEANPAAVVSPTVDQTTLTAKRLDGYTHVTNEDLEDAVASGGFVAQLLDQFAEAVGQKIDSCVFVGSGAPMSGVYKSAGYSQVFGSGSAAFSMLIEGDLRAAVAKVTKGRAYRWYAHHAVLWNTVYGIKDGNQRPLYLVSPIAGGGGQLLGYPVTEVPIAPSVSAVSTGFILFGDLQGVLIGKRSNALSFFVDPYTKGLSHQTIFAVFTRYAFAQHLPNMFCRIATPAS